MNNAVGQEEVFVQYRTRDGRLRQSWVFARYLDVCPPKTRDKAVVVRGPSAGRVYAASRYERNPLKVKTGVVMTQGLGKAKVYATFPFSDMTRVSEYNENA